jgi:hypothetical protein
MEYEIRNMNMNIETIHLVHKCSTYVVHSTHSSPFAPEVIILGDEHTFGLNDLLA